MNASNTGRCNVLIEQSREKVDNVTVQIKLLQSLVPEGTLQMASSVARIKKSA